MAPTTEADRKSWMSQPAGTMFGTQVVWDLCRDLEIAREWLKDVVNGECPPDYQPIREYLKGTD
jgi:hypothetical protein